MKVINHKHMNLNSRKKEFLNANPFPYLVIDEFLEPDYFKNLKKILNEMTSSEDGRNFDTEVENKKWISLNSSLPNLIKQIIDALHADEWVNNVQNLTGIDSLITTSHGNTILANYHEMEPGGFLGVHVDHSHEPVTGSPHVLNVLIYLTEDWHENDGGSTFFYDKTGKNIVSKVPYKQNRAVIFLHTPFSFHSVERISETVQKKRKSIYVDYYSKSYKPYNNINLNFSSKWFEHGTTFKLNSYFDYFKKENYHYTKTLIKYHLNRYGFKL